MLKQFAAAAATSNAALSRDVFDHVEMTTAEYDNKQQQDTLFNLGL